MPITKAIKTAHGYEDSIFPLFMKKTPEFYLREMNLSPHGNDKNKQQKTHPYNIITLA
jgi:hypothetical protein